MGQARRMQRLRAGESGRGLAQVLALWTLSGCAQWRAGLGWRGPCGLWAHAQLCAARWQGSDSPKSLVLVCRDKFRSRSEVL